MNQEQKKNPCSSKVTKKEVRVFLPGLKKTKNCGPAPGLGSALALLCNLGKATPGQCLNGIWVAGTLKGFHGKKHETNSQDLKILKKKRLPGTSSFSLSWTTPLRSARSSTQKMPLFCSDNWEKKNGPAPEFLGGRFYSFQHLLLHSDSLHLSIEWCYLLRSWWISSPSGFAFLSGCTFIFLICLWYFFIFSMLWL